MDEPGASDGRGRSDPPPPPPPPGGTEPPSGATPPPPGGTPPPSTGLSTGAKVLLGCGAVFLLGTILTVVAVGAGGIFLKNRISDVRSSLEEQGRAHEEATEIFRSLEREHPFEPPEGGLVEDHRARRFFRVTDHAWADMEEWAVELRDLGERMEGRSDPSVSDMAAGFRSIGRLSESRLVLARALEREGMAPAEYIWTGLALTRAYENVERTADAAVVPEENVALARRYRSELAAIEGDGDGPDKGAVLGIAVMWGMADLSTWRAMGLDTLHTLR